MTTGKDFRSEADEEGAEVGTPSTGPAESAPAQSPGAREGRSGRPVRLPSDYVCHTLDLDAETRMEIQLWRQAGSQDLVAQALAIRRSGPPFAAVGEVTAQGVRFYARPPGSPVPSRERAVCVDWSPAFPPAIRVEEQRRTGRVG